MNWRSRTVTSGSTWLGVGAIFPDNTLEDEDGMDLSVNTVPWHRALRVMEMSFSRSLCPGEVGGLRNDHRTGQIRKLRPTWLS